MAVGARRADRVQSIADDWRLVLEPIVARYRNLDIRRFFRGDAAFARPELYEYLEAEGYLYAIRLPAKPKSPETQGDSGAGLLGSAMNASTGADSGRIMAWKRPDTPSTEQKNRLPISRSAIESSRRPTMGRPMKMVLLVCCCLLFAGCAQLHQQQGQKYLEDMNYTAAIDSFGKSIWWDRGGPMVWLARATAYNKLERYTEGSADCDEAIHLDPQLGDAYIERSLPRLMLGNPKGAVHDCDKAIALGMRRPVVYLRRGLGNKNLGKLEQALDDYAKAIEIDPGYWHSYCARAVIYGDRRQYEEALADETVALGLVTEAREKAFVLTNRSDSLFNLHRVPEAIVDLDAAIQADPTYAKAWENRGVTANRMGKFDQAIGDFTEAIRLAPGSANAYLGRGNAYGDKQQLRMAVDDFTRAIGLEPNCLLAWYNRAFTRGQLRDFRGAVGDYTAAIGLWENGRGVLPFGPMVAFNNRGEGYMNLRDYKQALADFNTALEYAPEDPSLYTARSHCHMALGDHQKAIQDASRAIELSRYPHAYAMRGLVRSRMGDIDGAVSDMNEAVKLSPRDPYVYATRGLVLKAKGDYVGAKRDFEKVLELDPSDTQSRVNLQDAERKLDQQRKVPSTTPE